MYGLAKVSEDSLHADILMYSIHDAEHSPLVANWASGVRKQSTNLGMATPYPGGVVGTVDVQAFQRAMLSQEGVCLARLARVTLGCTFTSLTSRQAVRLFPLIRSA